MARAPPVSGRFRLTPTHELAEALDAAAGRDQVDRFAVEHRGLRRRGHVDDRRGAGDGDGFLERADAEFGVERRGEFRRQLEAVAPERLEAGQRERHACRCRDEGRRCDTRRRRR